MHITHYGVSCASGQTPPNDRVLRHGTTRMTLQDKPAVSGREREAGEVRGPALVTQLAVLVSQT